MTLERFVEIMRKGGATNAEIQARMTQDEMASLFDRAFPQTYTMWMCNHRAIEQRIYAIKRVREIMGNSLKESKDFVEGAIPLSFTVQQQRDLNDYLRLHCCGIYTDNAAYVG